MNSQQSLEKAFKERDIASIRKLVNNRDLDFSFNNNYMLNTIVSESLHYNFIVLIKNKPECFDNVNLQDLAIKSLINNNYKIFKFLSGSINYNDLLLNNEDNFFTSVAKFGDIKSLKLTLHYFLNLAQDNIEIKTSVLEYIKNGITLALNTYSYEAFNLLYFSYLTDPFENHLFIRTILSLPEGNNRQLFIKNLSKNFIDCSFIIHYTDFKQPIINIDFINCYEINDFEKQYMKSYIFRYAYYFVIGTLRYSQYISKKQEYDDFTKIIFNNLIIINNINHKKNNENISNLISDIIDNNKFFEKNDLIIYLLTVYNHFDNNILKATISNLNHEVFDFIYKYFDLDTRTEHKFLFLALPTKDLHSKEQEYFNNKIINTKIMQSCFLDPVSVYDILRNHIMLYNYFFINVPNFLNYANELNSIISVYNNVIDYEEDEEYEHTEHSISFKKIVGLNFGFNYVDVEDLINRIKYITEEKSILIHRAYKLYHF